MFRIAIVGRQHQGKSVLANALIGRPGLLPEAPVACTDAIVEVTQGREGWASLCFEDGGGVQGAWTSLSGFCSATTEREDRPARVDVATVTIDHPALDGVTIVDLPGLDSLDARHHRLVDRGIAHCDAVLLVTRLEQGIGKVERELMRRLSESHRQVLAVIGNVARHGESDEAESLATMRRVSSHQSDLVAALLGPAVPYVAWNLRDMGSFGQGALVLRLARALSAEVRDQGASHRRHEGSR